MKMSNSCLAQLSKITKNLYQVDQVYNLFYTREFSNEHKEYFAKLHRLQLISAKNQHH